MQPPYNQFHHHPNGIMTAPRTRRFANGLGSDGESNGGGGGEVIQFDVNSVPRKNLFSPQIGGGDGSIPAHSNNSKMKNHYQQQLAFHNEENLVNHHQYTPMKTQYGHAALAPFTPERTPRTTTTTTAPGGLNQCGLSAMISLETSYRTPSKSTATKRKHRRNPSSVSRLFPTPTTATPMRTSVTTNKKHKRSTTTSSLLMLSTPSRTTTATQMRTNNHVNNTQEDDLVVKRDLNWAIPNTDTKLIATKSNHCRTPSWFQSSTPQKRKMFEVEDFSSFNSSRSISSGNGSSRGNDEHDGGEKNNEGLSSIDTTEEIIVIPSAAAAPPPPPSATPKQKLRRTLPIPSPNLTALSARKKLKKQVTPPRHYYSSHAVDTNSNPDEMGLLGTGFEGLDMYRMTSTELDPSNFQIELPSKKEVLVHAKICNLMNGYTAVQRDFNFAMLSGITRSTLEKEYVKSTNEDPMIAGICHRDVVKQVLECADDLVVEGFFREYGKVNREENGGERIEACVFSSESLRQIIVCFRGSTAAQAKPVKSNSFLFGREASAVLDDEKQKVRILTSFQSAYFSTSLEKTLSFLLANLATRKPFFDVVMTGHSFGAVMATIASLRYAMENSQMRVICHTFGSPRIGGEEWRQLVHSVPNLRLYRVEKANDSFVTMPNGHDWVHCGHSIQFGDVAQQVETEQFTAHRFDRSAPNASLSQTLQKVASEPVRVLKSVQSVATEPGKVLRSVQSKVGSIPIQGSSNGKDAIQSYVDNLSSSGDSWFTEFSGMKGKGVSGLDNELRTLA